MHSVNPIIMLVNTVHEAYLRLFNTIPRSQDSSVSPIQYSASALYPIIPFPFSEVFNPLQVVSTECFKRVSVTWSLFERGKIRRLFQAFALMER